MSEIWGNQVANLFWLRIIFATTFLSLSSTNVHFGGALPIFENSLSRHFRVVCFMYTCMGRIVYIILYIYTHTYVQEQGSIQEHSRALFKSYVTLDSVQTSWTMGTAMSKDLELGTRYVRRAFALLLRDFDGSGLGFCFVLQFPAHGVSTLNHISGFGTR